MFDEIPKPDFELIEEEEISTEANNDDRPPSLDIDTQLPNLSADCSPNNSNSDLSPGDRKSLRTFLSLINSFTYSTERLYEFCEHFFNEELTQMAVDQLNKHVAEFHELLSRISCQQQVEKDLKQSILPSPVTFSISTWRNRSFDEWPIPTSDNWVRSAANTLKVTPPDISKSPKKSTPPLEERLAKADKNRTKMDNLRNREIRAKTNKVRRANELRVQKQEKAITAFNEKQDSAAQRREALINQIKKKARDETEKVQETRYMQELEDESRKLKIEKMMNKVSERYENMIQEKREKAKVRTAFKMPTSPDGSPNRSPSRSPKTKRQTISKLSVMDSFSNGQLPGEFLDVVDEYSNTIPAIELPEFDDAKFAQKSQNPSQQIKQMASKLDHNDLNPQGAISYLKAASEQKVYIQWNSNEGQMIRDTLQHMIYTNISNTNLLIHNVINCAEISYPFALHIAFECVSSFQQLCYKRDSLATTKELLLLWTLILTMDQYKEQNEPKPLLIGHLIRHSVLMKLCYVLEVSTADESRNELVKTITQQILLLLYACANHIRYHYSELNAEFIDLFGHASTDFIIPGLRRFLSNSITDTKLYSTQMVITAIRIYQIISLHFPVFLTKLINQDYAKSIAKLLKFYYNDKDQNPQIMDELIVLIGLLCKHSELMKESLQWLPQPTILSLLCQMPFNYLSSPDKSIVLIPTVAACCLGNDANLEFVRNNINGSFIIKFFSNTKDDPKSLFASQYRVPASEIPKVIQLFTVNK